MRVLAAAHEVGAANALVPVIEELSRRGGAHLTTIACGKASSVFIEAGIEHVNLETPIPLTRKSYARVIPILEAAEPEVLLLGSGLGVTIDKALLRATRDTGIPSLTILDMWSNYRARFCDPVTGDMFLPTKVAVMDRMAFDEAIKSGLPASALVITGQPHLEALTMTYRTRVVINKAAALRRQWLRTEGLEVGTLLVLFVSEAMAKGFGKNDYQRYTEAEVLEGLIEALESIEEHTRIEVVAKLHPEESLGTFRMGPKATKRGVRVVKDEWAPACVLAADIVVGMTSMVLLEAVIAGRFAVSFQPGVSDTNSFAGTRMGVVPARSSRQELASLLRGSLERLGTANNTSRLPGFVKQGSITRVTDLLFEIAAHAKPEKESGDFH